MQLLPCPLLSYLLAVARDRGASTVSSRGAGVGCFAGGATAVGSAAGGPGTCGGVLDASRAAVWPGHVETIEVVEL